VGEFERAARLLVGTLTARHGEEGPLLPREFDDPAASTLARQQADQFGSGDGPGESNLASGAAGIGFGQLLLGGPNTGLETLITARIR